MGECGGGLCPQHGTSVGSPGEHGPFSLYCHDKILCNCDSPAQNLATSLIMWVAVALYSPVLFILSVIGAVLGSFLPLIFLSNNLLYLEDRSDIFSYSITHVPAPDTYSSVYIGLWGYSSILSIACVAWAQFEFSK